MKHGSTLSFSAPLAFSALWVLLALLASPGNGFAQDDAPAPAEDPLAKIFGDGGMNLKCQRMESTMGAQSGQLESMRMKGGVDIKSEQMDLKCDDLVIDMEKQMMIAKGKIVRFVQGGVEGTCGRLEYDIESGKTTLTGTPKPSILQTDANGRVTETSADEITLTPVEGGGTGVALEGNAELNVRAANGTKSGDGATTKTKKTARDRKVTPKNVGALKSPSVGK